MKSRWFFALALCLAPALAGGQEVLIDDSFSEDPLANGWIFNLATAWVPPEATQCCDGAHNIALDPVDPCTVYDEVRLDDLGEDPAEFGGYVLVTPGVNGQAGNAFRDEKDAYDNFKLTVVVEMRDGTTLGQPADGMCVVVVGTDEPPADAGAGGGGMGAPCVGAPDNAPILVWEFDDWSCNTGDSGNDNHVGFAYSPNGVACTDSLPPQVFRPITPRLHTREAPNVIDLAKCLAEPAPANRVQLTVFAQRCGGALTVAADVNFLDQGINLGRVFTRVVNNFVPFEGYLGVTASTGGANQAHILHSAKLETLAPGFCLQPAASASRSIIPADGRDVANACGDFQGGDELTVAVTLESVRAASECCPRASSITVRDELPPNWTAANPSNGGQVVDAGRTVQWLLEGAAIVNGARLTYTATAVDNGNRFETFSGTVVENVALSIPTLTAGQDRATKDTPFDDCGGITCWNVLGPYIQPAGQIGDNPGVDNMREDYLTDGDSTETDFPFFPGATIATAYDAEAKSAGLVNTGQATVNPDGVPTVLAWNDPDAYVNLNDDVYRNDPNTCMSYAQINLLNASGDDIECSLGASSDDSIQVILNGEEVWIISVPRGGQANACTPQNSSPDGITFFDPLILEPGENSLIVKTFEGGGGFNYTISLINLATGLPISEEDGVSVSKYPQGICPVAPVVATRSVDTGETTTLELGVVPKWSPDTSYPVVLAISDVRPAGTRASCPNAAGEVRIVEKVPTGWEASNASNGGAISVDRSTITWVLQFGGGAGAGGPSSLSYSVQSGEGDGVAQFSGTVSEPGNDATFAVRGAGRLSNPSQFTGLGFWKEWLLLGPYQQPTGFGWGAAISTDNIELDWLTDGEIAETEIEPREGDTIDTDYVLSPAISLLAALGSPPPAINAGGVPTWFAWRDADDTIAYETYYGGDVNQCMMYSVVYAVIDDDITVDIGLASDDSVQVLLDGVSIWTNSIARGSGGANIIQDVIPAIALDAGIHQFMVKVFEGGGGHNFRLRFQDEFAEPVTEGVTLCFSPDIEECGGKVVPTGIGPFVRGDVSGNGGLELTDAVATFNFLFLGGPAPRCLAAADSSGQGQVNLTSGVFTLNFLFLGGPAPPAPYPACARSETARDLALGCLTPQNPCP